MTTEASVTLWIKALRQGDTLAAESLWERYFQNLMLQARLRMSNLNRACYDEEDAALSTFQVLCAKLQQGRYESLSDRGELWQLMLTVLIRKIGRRVKYQRAAKRGHELNGSIVPLGEDIAMANSQEISQECFELIASLQDPNLEQVALLKFEGYTNDEIAEKLNRTRRTIQRMLNLIRALWQDELKSD